MGLLKLNSEEDLNKQLSLHRYLLVDCYATWCSPCKRLHPVLEEVNNERDNVEIVKVDIDEVDEFCDLYDIESIPTIVFYKDSKIVDKVLGVLTKEELNSKLDSLTSDEKNT